MPQLTRINIYPIKSLDGHSVEHARVLPSGALEHDRRYAIFDRHGDWVNGKRSPSIHVLRSTFDEANNRLRLRLAEDAEEHSFHMERDRAALAALLSDYLGFAVDLMENSAAGFPDDVESPGPTVISVATLREVGSWFGLGVDETRARFRPNLEIDGVEPFWEDRLVGEEDRVVRFRIGSAELLGTNPCQRCPVPTRHPWTGIVTPLFARRFGEQRAATLPTWAPASRFDHFYRLAVNTRPSGVTSHVLRVGDEVSILE
jgi:uncharacterized protein